MMFHQAFHGTFDWAVVAEDMDRASDGDEQLVQKFITILFEDILRN